MQCSTSTFHLIQRFTFFIEDTWNWFTHFGISRTLR